MELRLYDTLTRAKRKFTPLDAARVRMYVCGPTVYDFAHIGNARPVIVFDVLFRLLRHIYGADHVTYVRNVTDVDDKINARAAERGISIRDLTEETYKNFKADVAALGCLEPTVEPRATEHIEQMKTLIDRLVKSGNAYVAEDNVLFNVPSMPDYGKLSNRTLDEMIAGSRVEVAPYKKDPQDFVLWKPSKPGEPSWPSPAGVKTPGRPGWHIECSAMAWKHLGETFDIHGGGIDLVFPHHENEIAQSRCAFHTGVMANYWMHNGFLQVEGEKMSKSLGNFVTIRDLLTGWKGREWPGAVIRLAMLKTHYRQPIDWTAERLVEADVELGIFKNTVRMANPDRGQVLPDVVSALCDDLNTHLALQALMRKENKPDDLAKSLMWLGVMESNAFELGRIESADRRRAVENAQKKTEENEILTRIGLDRSHLVSLIAARNAARAAKNFEESDRIRDELAAMGVVLKDSKDGTTWEIAR
jgi:cysteinyl-tRNA synthetase